MLGLLGLNYFQLKAIYIAHVGVVHSAPQYTGLRNCEVEEGWQSVDSIRSELGKLGSRKKKKCGCERN